MKIVDVKANPDKTLRVIGDNGFTGIFDLKPYLQYEAFAELSDDREFEKISNGGYFVEWACGADLSADTIEAKWVITDKLNISA
jgi:hypothetical protein